MIIKMNKYVFLVYHKEYEDFLIKIRDLGVIHIKETKPTKEIEELRTILLSRRRLADLIRQLKNVNAQYGNTPAPFRGNISETEGENLIESVEAINESIVRTGNEISKKEKELKLFEPWGKFKYEDLNKLKEAGWEIDFYSCPLNRFDNAWKEKYNAVIINNFQSEFYFITATPSGTRIEVDAEHNELPAKDCYATEKECEALRAEAEALNERLKTAAKEVYNKLSAYDKKLQDDFNFSNALIQGRKEVDDKVVVVEGWIPESEAPAMEKAVSAMGYYCLPQEITEEDKVPVKLKNNAFARLFEPITKMFSLPNYNELDPTPLFAPFFMLFFGMCFGDGGYGLLVLIVCTLLKKKAKPDMKPVLSLFQYLGSAAILVGALTGSVFGVSLAHVEAFGSVKDYFLTSDNMMPIAIVIGLIQIIFGKIVAAVKIRMQKGVKYSIAPFAWVFVISFGLIAFALPKFAFPPLAVRICYGIAGAGLLIALFYNSPGKNPFVNLGTGLWNAYNTASGLLGDTLSYIRLFAIGLTSAILGSVFNSLAIDTTAGMNIVLRIILMLIILSVGHAMNFGLAMISSLVHPLRLVFVEYYKNAEFEGGGKPYAPFKKIEEKQN